MKVKRLISTIFALTLILGLWIGCGKKEGVNPVPKTTEVALIDTLYGAADTLQAGDTLIITARVVDEEDMPKQGEWVDFSTTYGTLNPPSAVSDSLGEAWANLIAPANAPDTSATVTAKVRSSGNSMELSVPIKRRGEVTPGEPFNLSLEVTPTSLLANENDTATVTATVTDINWDPVPDGTPVAFVAGERFADLNGDGYFTPGVDQQQQPPEARPPSTISLEGTPSLSISRPPPDQPKRRPP